MSARNKHILLIDDDQDIHTVVRLILEPLGYRVSCHSTGPSGLEALRRERPALLLLDIMLSSPNEGLVLANEIKRDPELESIPIIMISSIGQLHGTDYARELGGDGVPVEAFLEKPLDPRLMRETVNSILKP
ncbi:MAG: response regulator [Planctomycetota bacterium]